MATTSNFGWETPDDTDLVKDGALAIRTLGNNIDTSLVDLKGGTTGQILSKNSNTDLDYTWINNDQGDITEVQAGTGISVASGTGPVPVVTNTVATTFDAKGDLVVGTGADTFAKRTVGTNEHRLVADSAETTGLKYVADTTNYAIAAKGDILAGTAADTVAPLTLGTNNQVLTVDTSTATGLKWAAVAGGGKVLQVVQATSTTETTTTSATYGDTNLSASITPSSASSKILVIFDHAVYQYKNQTAADSISMNGKFRLVRGATAIQDYLNIMNFSLSHSSTGFTGINLSSTVTRCYLDSPNTTSSTTYKTQFALNSAPAGGNLRVSTDSNPSNITLIEIGA